jgi:predicted ABC-type transport system involved in lysophospholipase L1 biosynthesis ATPase subunit
VALVFQSPSLLAPLNVQENVAVPLLLDGVDEDQAHAASRAALERIGIDQLAHKLPDELSAGQAQRVAMARALASKPRIIFADEPTGQLDHPTAQQLLASLFAALDDQIAVVLATHDREVAARLAQQWHMSHGTLTAS